MDPFSVDPFGDGSESRATVVGGRSVTVLKRLAEGGFGSVDLVRDASSGQNIVLKTMMVMGDENTEQLMNEVKVMRALGSHPHIVRLLEAQSTRLASDKIKVEMLLENCPGGTLLDKLNSRSSALPLNQALGCFGQIVSAVAHMHKMSPPIAHRDLKLENVLIGADKKLRLCDFGSVSDRQGPIKDKRDRTDEQDRIERFTTPHFRAPEMVDLYSSHAIDERVDVWALGCLWHAILFLSHPFQTTGVLAIVSATYTLPDEAASTPPICIELLRACLRIDPEERPTCEAILSFIAAASRAMKVGGGERALRQSSTASKLRALLLSKAGKQCPTGEEQSATVAAESAKGKGGRSRAHRAKAAAPSAVDAVLSLAQQGAQAGGGGSGSSTSSSRRTRGGRQIGGKGKQATGTASKRGRGSRPEASSSAAAAAASAGGGDDGGSDWSPFGGDDSAPANPGAGKTKAKKSTATDGGDGSDFDPFGDDGGDDPPASGASGGAAPQDRDEDGDDFDPFCEGGGGDGGGDTQAGLQPPSDDEDEDDLFGSDAPSNASGGPGSQPKAAGGAQDEDDDDLFGGVIQEGSGSSTAAVAPPGGSSAVSTGALGSVGASSTGFTPRSLASGPGPHHASGASFASAHSIDGQSAAGYGGLKRFASTGMPIGQQGPGMGGMGMGAGMGAGSGMGMGSISSPYGQQAGVGYPMGMQSAGGLAASYGGMPGGGMGHRGAYSQQFASHSGMAGAGGYSGGMGSQQAMPQGGMMGAGAMHGRSASQGPQPTQPMSRDDVSRMLAQRSGAGSRPGTGT